MPSWAKSLGCGLELAKEKGAEGRSLQKHECSDRQGDSNSEQQPWPECFRNLSFVSSPFTVTCCGSAFLTHLPSHPSSAWVNFFCDSFSHFP